MLWQWVFVFIQQDPNCMRGKMRFVGIKKSANSKDTSSEGWTSSYARVTDYNSMAEEHSMCYSMAIYWNVKVKSLSFPATILSVFHIMYKLKYYSDTNYCYQNNILAYTWLVAKLIFIMCVWKGDKLLHLHCTQALGVFLSWLEWIM